MNTQLGDLTTILSDLRQEELRMEAARGRLAAQATRGRLEVTAPRRPRRTAGGLFLAALTRPVVAAARPWSRAMPHRDGA